MVAGPVMLSLEEVADRVGLAVKTVRNYRNRARDRPGFFPDPDGWLGNRPWWRPETIDAWQASRPGRGAKGRPRRRRS